MEHIDSNRRKAIRAALSEIRATIRENRAVIRICSKSEALKPLTKYLGAEQDMMYRLQDLLELDLETERARIAAENQAVYDWQTNPRIRMGIDPAGQDPAGAQASAQNPGYPPDDMEPLRRRRTVRSTADQDAALAEDPDDILRPEDSPCPVAMVPRRTMPERT